tara:strand:+ start:209 stop:700 length:492 start_codon:yes stop_codon:yes gene_type:complete
MFEFIRGIFEANFQDPRFLLSVICLILAGLFRAWLYRLSNTVAFESSVFKSWRRDFWLKSESVNRKYKSYATGKLIVSHYDKKNKAIYKPAFAFLGLRSDKSLVFVSDGWHIINFLKSSCVCFAVVFASGLSIWSLWFWALWILMRGAFAGSYDSVFRARGRS